MKLECENLEKCGFFLKYRATNELACKGFIAKYCIGGKMTDCKRRVYKKEQGVSPTDDMMPNGMLIKY